MREFIEPNYKEKSDTSFNCRSVVVISTLGSGMTSAEEKFVNQVFFKCRIVNFVSSYNYDDRCSNNLNLLSATEKQYKFYPHPKRDDDNIRIVKV